MPIAALAAASGSPAAQGPTAKPTPGFEQLRKVDIHSHIYEDLPVVNAMLRRINLRVINVSVPATDGHMAFMHRFNAGLVTQHPDLFSWASTFDVAARNEPDYGARIAKALDETFAKGAVMVKIWKEVGLELKRPDGSFVLPDDPIFDPVYAHLALRKKPLLAHLAEPREAWLPLDPKGVHYGYYSRNPKWHLYGRPEFPSHERLMESRDHILAKHPTLIVIGAHVGSLEWDVDEVAKRLDKYPNFYVEVSARTRDLTRQPPRQGAGVLREVPGPDPVRRRSLVDAAPDAGREADRRGAADVRHGARGAVSPRLGLLRRHRLDHLRRRHRRGARSAQGRAREVLLEERRADHRREVDWSRHDTTLERTRCGSNPDGGDAVTHPGGGPPWAEDATSVVAAASKAMGVDTLSSITYSGTARNGAFGQSKAIGEPMGPVNVTTIAKYTRTLRFDAAGEPTALVSRATGPTQPPAIPGVPALPAGVFNQNVTSAQAGSSWAQALNIWTTPWGFLKGAAAPGAQVRQQGGQQVVSFSPANLKSPSGQVYTVTGYVNAQNLVTKVETRVDNAVVGDLLVEFDYANYRSLNGVQVPGRIVQRQAGMQTFDASIEAATPNPPNLAELLTLPAPAAGAHRLPRLPRPPPARRRSRSSAKASSESAATTRLSPSTWAITSSSSKAGSTTGAARRSWPQPSRPFPERQSVSSSRHTRTSTTPVGWGRPSPRGPRS